VAVVAMQAGDAVAAIVAGAGSNIRVPLFGCS